MSANDLSTMLVTSADLSELIKFLTGQRWPFHVAATVSADQVRLESYLGADTVGLWLMGEFDTRVGLVRIFDLDDETPMFDLRIAESARGRGYGSSGLLLLTMHIFVNYPHVQRIEGTTRQDNIAMRKAFVRNNYVKESHYRQSWPGPGGEQHDPVGYAILRQDFEDGEVTAVQFDDWSPEAGSRP